MTRDADLTPNERRALEVLRALPPPDQHLEARLGAAARGAAAHSREHRRGGSGRVVATTLVLAAAMVAFLLIGREPAPSRSPGPALAAEDPPRTSVEFTFVGDSHAVALLGDFNDWDASATPLRQVSPRVWRATVALAPGLYAYSFLVDGERWVADLAAARAAADDFGRPSSVLLVPGET